MEIKYFTQGINLTQESKNLLEKKLLKLEHFSNKIWEAKIDASYRATRPRENSFRLEVNLKMPDRILRGVATSSTLQNSIDQVEDKLKQQLRKYKGFIQTRKRITQKIMRKLKSIK
ncbi:ribosome-associated translation inhibitor RaiA [Patescibacteria group bacterium]|nr:ribosome-associated translation inhibitor RaiA [Patescibacteria group bacterium]